MEESVPNKAALPQQQSPGSAANLDSFFKRLGQGQSSRLWAGPGRSGAVPGVLRTRLHPKRNEAGDESSYDASINRTVASAGGGRVPTGRAGVGSVNTSNLHSEDARRPDGGEGNGASAATSAARSANAGAGSARRRRNRTGEEESLSPLGFTGGWSELEGAASGGSAAAARSVPTSLPARMRSSTASSFGSGSGDTLGISSGGGIGGRPSTYSRGNSDVGDDPLSAAPDSPAPIPSPRTPSPSKALKSTTAAAAAVSSAVATTAAATAAAAGTVAVATAPSGTQMKPSVRPAAKPLIKPAVETTPPPPPSQPSYRDKRFDDVLGQDVVKLDELRKLSWNGVPHVHRATVWQLLVGYMPANRARRAAALGRKRREYREAVPQYFDVPDAARSNQEQNILRQILVDVPRTCPDVPFFHQDKVQRAMERILYIWAIRHPASGYVQGINDLMTPLYIVFLSAHVGPSVESKDVSKVDERLLDEVEADVYWCLTKLLDNIQDHYTAMQPGLQRMVLRLEELVQRIDAELHRHITEEGLLYIQFAFRWMNCLLMRELPQRAVVRAWDTYLAEENGFESFHVYVSAALLCHFSSTLREMDFQTMVMFLQDMPTKEWGEDEVEPLLSQAYILSTLFEGSPNHLGAS